MSKLDKYQQKRKFSETPEPEGSIDLSEGSRFVVQRHEASRLHYDLRLEIGGVLKSWAIPKGPSLDPQDKRLAIMTEDHPLQYLNFEGIIPKRNYGAGRMRVWDTGNFKLLEMQDKPERAIAEGSLKLQFDGEKLKGQFALVRIKQSDKNEWLLIKKHDNYNLTGYNSEDHIDELAAQERQREARVIDLHTTVKPMLATKAKTSFNRKGWLFEIKWDGYRAIASTVEDECRLYSRNGLSFKNKFAQIYEALQELEHEVILDGELVYLDEEGDPQFQAMQNYSDALPGQLKYYVFDMLHLNGHDMLDLPLRDRKSLIEEVISGIPHFEYCDHVFEKGEAFFEQALASKLEGIIAKDAQSKYLPGLRSDKWLKVKAKESQEALICGYTAGERAGGNFGSLILGIFEGTKLQYIGNVGSGFNEQIVRDLLAKLKNLQRKSSPFPGKINLKGRTAYWCKPELICEVEFSEWTKEGRLRHPVYKGLRHDKPQTAITREKETMPRAKATTNNDGVLEVDGVKVSLSNLDKVYWPEEGLTKYDLINYYLQVAEVILPYLQDRPQNLHRHPNGINSPGFYQKDTAEILPHWVDSVRVYSKGSEREIEYLICQNTAGLLYLANLGCIELNPWHVRQQNITEPDYAVLDLDPGPQNNFDQVIEVAQAAKQVIDRAKLHSFPKTSGSRGLHIYLPLQSGYNFEQSRDFTLIIAQMVQQELPEITSLERSPKKRKDRIYLDYLQNRRGQTLAAPYCVRPKSGATVSAPLRWKEVKAGLKREDFNIHTMPQRIDQEGDLFAGLFSQLNSIEMALERWEG